MEYDMTPWLLPVSASLASKVVTAVPVALFSGMLTGEAGEAGGPVSHVGSYSLTGTTW